MADESIIEKLDQLAGVTEAYTEISETKNSLRWTRMTAEERAAYKRVQELTSEIDAEFKPQIAALNDREAVLRSQIQKGVKEATHSIKGSSLMGVYVPPKQSVILERFLGYAADKPELAQFLKTGDASVTIRANPPSKKADL